MAYLLEAKNVQKKFGDFTAVKNLSLSVEPGECLALLGPNGAGKTTTFEMFEGLISPSAGEIRIFEKTWKEHRRSILPRIGVQLQETSLYKRFTVKETLDLFASFYEKTADLAALLALVGLTDKTNIQLKDLSGGQKQRVYLAAALINEPELIFLDEPTTGLDPAARRDIWQIVEELKKKGVGILLSTHYMEEAETLATKVAIMDQGQIIALGTPRELIAKYGKSAPAPNGSIRETMGTKLAQNSLQSDSDSYSPGTLEEVFLTLTGRKINHE